MDFALGYLIGSGASWESIFAALFILAVIVVILYNVFGIE